MTVSSIIDTASAGLRATQAGLDVVSQNVANAGSIGYTRRVLTTVENVSGTGGTGVNVAGVQRTLDTLLQRQLRLETAGASYTSAMASTHAALDAAFDQTAGAASLSSQVSTFTSALQKLGIAPSAYQNKTAVLSAAKDLAGSLNTLSDTVQGLRQDAETSIGADVSNVNDLLRQITSVNNTITSSVAGGSSPALLDQRDGLIDRLSSLVDLKVTPGANGTVTLATTGGLQLFDGQKAVTLSFDARSPVLAQSAYNRDPAQRSVGTITATDAVGHTTDVIASGAIRSGSLAAHIELRDSVLPQAQTQLDALAAGLASALSDKSVAGTAVASPPGYSLDLSDLQNGRAATLTYVDANNATQSVNLVRVDDPASLGAVAKTNGGTSVGIDFSGGSGSVASQVAKALAGRGLTVSGSGTSVQVTGVSGGVPSVSSLTKAVTVTGVQSGDSQLPLFVDGGRSSPANVYTGAIAGGTAQLTGFASRIAVNTAVTGDPDTLVKYDSTTAGGDTTRPAFLLDRLTNATGRFTAAAGIGAAQAGFSGSVSDFAQQVISFQAAASISASNLNEGQQTVLGTITDRFTEKAGVNIDTELTQLIQLQTAYSANARVMTAAKDLLDTLFRTVQ